jgi:hypothetical protein
MPMPPAAAPPLAPAPRKVQAKREAGPRPDASKRGALGALTALERRAVLALAEVRSQAPRSALESLRVLQAGERRLRFVAGKPALELLAKSAAGAEDQGLDGADRDVEHVGDLRVRASFELAHDEGGALVEGEEAEGAADLGGGRNVGFSVAAAASESSNSTSRGRRDESRKRWRQTLCAILISQLCGVCGRSPRWNAR